MRIDVEWLPPMRPASAGATLVTGLDSARHRRLRLGGSALLAPFEGLDAFESATIVPLGWKDNFALQFLRANFCQFPGVEQNKIPGVEQNKSRRISFSFSATDICIADLLLEISVHENMRD